MTQTYANPEFPFGEFQKETKLSDQRRAEILQQVKAFPAKLSAALIDLTLEQKERTYRQWTIIQIVNHLGDAQMNWFLRFKQALTTLRPTVVPYDQSDWVQLADAISPDLTASLAIIQGVNARWFELASYMPSEDFGRTMVHPEHGKELTLDHALSLSTWHCYHHLAQIDWMKSNIFSKSTS